jgi:hypothetical protein
MDFLDAMVIGVSENIGQRSAMEDEHQIIKHFDALIKPHMPCAGLPRCAAASTKVV